MRETASLSDKDSSPVTSITVDLPVLDVCMVVVLFTWLPSNWREAGRTQAVSVESARDRKSAGGESPAPRQSRGVAQLSNRPSLG
jgi:hypothetical protein